MGTSLMSELAYHTHNQSYALRAAKDIVQLQKRLMDGMCDFTFWNSKLYVNKKKVPAKPQNLLNVPCTKNMNAHFFPIGALYVQSKLRP